MIPRTLALMPLLASLDQANIIDQVNTSEFTLPNRSAADCARILAPIDTYPDPFPLPFPFPGQIAITEYRVILKPFTAHVDILQILQLPLLGNVVPIAIFDQAKDKGFMAKLTREQLCYIGKSILLPVCRPNQADFIL
jgi:hypothetical protein